MELPQQLPLPGILSMPWSAFQIIFKIGLQSAQQIISFRCGAHANTFAQSPGPIANVPLARESPSVL